MKKKSVIVLTILMVFLLTSGAFASSVQIHPPWGQDGNMLFVQAFGKDRYLIVKTKTSAAINAAIDALGTEGGEVYLPEGTYAITASVVIDVDNITLRGAGGGTILSQGADCDGISVYNVASTIDNCLIENLVYDGASFAMSANTYLIEAMDVDNFVVRNVTLKNYEEGALYINVNNQRDGAAIVDGCTFLDASDASSIAIYYKNSSGNFLTGAHITNCEFKVCDVGIYLEEPGAIITNCKFTDCKDHAISNVNGGPNLGTIVSNNIFYSNDSYDIYLLNARDFIITNNVFSASGNSAIYIDAGYFHQISDNLFQEPGNITSIIYNTTADYCNIINNHFDFGALSADYCIYLNSHATENTIAGNLFDPSVDIAAIYVDGINGATGNIIFGNQNTTLAGTGPYLGELELTSPVVEFKLKRVDREIKTDNYVITAYDLGKSISMNSASDKTFTLPSVGSSDEGSTIILDKIGAGKLTIDAADTDYIHDSGAGDGLYSISSYASITLEYHDTDTRWYIKEANGTWVTYD